MRSRKILVPAVLSMYLAIAIGYALFDFYQERKRAILTLDSTLYAAAYSLDIILGRGFHDEYTPEHPPSAERYAELTSELNTFSSSLGLEYVYSMVKEGDTVFFVVSNETADDQKRGTPSVFHNPYPDPPKDLLDAFRTGRTQFYYYSSYVNIWNSYYSVFIPRTTPGGRTYVLAADIKLEYQKSLLRQCFLESLALICILLLPVAIVCWIFIVMTRQREVDLRKQLYLEPVTGLPSWYKFVKDMRRSRSGDFTLIVFNIDAFRDINNLFGEETGNAALSRIGGIIRSAARPADRVYKLPSDEFLVELSRDSLADTNKFALSILSRIARENFGTEGHPLDLTVRAGIVYRASRRDKALSYASMAVRTAKETKRDLFVYDPEVNMERQYSQNFFWLSKLKEALKADRIIPFYQPIVGGLAGHPAIYEALVRMIDADGGAIGPAQFLEVAKRSKLYRRITHTMIRKAFEDFSRTGRTVSLNFTARDIADAETVSLLLDSVRKYSMQNRVIIELVESEPMTRSTLLENFAQRVSSLGIRLAIDDFGSGYSNFEYLSRINVSYLKIDGSIVSAFPETKESYAIISAICSFAKKLGIAVVAECVSSEENRTLLHGLGVDYFQSFYLGMPKPFRELGIVGMTGGDTVTQSSRE